MIFFRMGTFIYGIIRIRNFHLCRIRNPWHWLSLCVRLQIQSRIRNRIRLRKIVLIRTRKNMPTRSLTLQHQIPHKEALMAFFYNLISSFKNKLKKISCKKILKFFLSNGHFFLWYDTNLHISQLSDPDFVRGSDLWHWLSLCVRL